jgi:exonuclease VII large subunit
MTLPLDETPWTPSLLTRTARRVVEGNIGAIWVRGEVSGLKAYQSGHWYFSLRDAEAQVRCVMWKTYTARFKSPRRHPGVFATPTGRSGASSA